MRLTVLKYGTVSKLGPTVAHLSRPIGPACPSSCPFLGNGCYKEDLDKFRPSGRKAAERNYLEDYTVWGSALEADLRRLPEEAIVRLHVGGDFVRDGDKLDVAYLEALEKAFTATHRGRPWGWSYTHAWRYPGMAEWRDRLAKAGITVFASTHTNAESVEAHAAGWRVAKALQIHKKHARAGMLRLESGLPILSCPEQVKGCDKIDCGRCGWCFKPGETRGVAFWRH